MKPVHTSWLPLSFTWASAVHRVISSVLTRRRSMQDAKYSRGVANG